MIFALQLQLFFALGYFLFQLLLEYIKQVRVILFSTLLFLMVLGLFISNLLTRPKPITHPELISIPAPVGISSETLTLEEYNQKLNTLSTLANLQPTHRDILIDLSFLLEAQGQTAQAREYWLAAQRLDPNNDLFVQSPLSTTL